MQPLFNINFIISTVCFRDS